MITSLGHHHLREQMIANRFAPNLLQPTLARNFCQRIFHQGKAYGGLPPFVAHHKLAAFIQLGVRRRGTVKSNMADYRSGMISRYRPPGKPLFFLPYQRFRIIYLRHRIGFSIHFPIQRHYPSSISRLKKRQFPFLLHRYTSSLKKAFSEPLTQAFELEVSFHLLLRFSCLLLKQFIRYKPPDFVPVLAI